MSTRDYTPLRAEPKSFPKKDDGTLSTNAQDRLNKGYHEVCFGYLLAKFALVSLRNWIGKLPKYDSAGRPISNGTGLLGIPYLVGCTAAKLNPLCWEFVTGTGYRMPGFFENDKGEYDGGVNFDRNGVLDLVLFAAHACRVCKLLPQDRDRNRI